MNHELFPEKIYNELVHYNKSIEVVLVRDHIEEGGYAEFTVRAQQMHKAELDILFNLVQYKYAYVSNGKICVDVEIGV
jgi:hypothetical protein